MSGSSGLGIQTFSAFLRRSAGQPAEFGCVVVALIALVGVSDAEAQCSRTDGEPNRGLKILHAGKMNETLALKCCCVKTAGKCDANPTFHQKKIKFVPLLYCHLPKITYFFCLKRYLNFVWSKTSFGKKVVINFLITLDFFKCKCFLRYECCSIHSNICFLKSSNRLNHHFIVITKASQYIVTKF